MINKNVIKLIEGGSRFVDENPKIVQSVQKIALYNDEPKLYSYGINFKDKYGEQDDDSVASGVSFYKQKALIKVLGEAIERYALSINNNNNFIEGSFNKLKNLNRNVLDLEEVVSFTGNTKQYLEDLRTKKLHWVAAVSLISNKEIIIPAQLVYVPFTYHSSEPLLRFPISTGAAAGENLDDSIYRGICEIVERDSFMIGYLNKLDLPKIDLNQITDPDIINILSILERYMLDLTIIDTTTDLHIPSFAAIITDNSGLGPAVSVGLKAGFNLKDGIIGAIEEAIMVRTWIRDRFIYANPKYKRKKIISTFEDRAHFWLDKSSIKLLDFWLKGNNLKKINLKNHEIKVLYITLSDKSLNKYGFKVVKVIIPSLQPLHLDEEKPYLGGKRLYSAPVAMGLLKQAKNKNEFNKIPHPFL
jgi:ribosomal protein S12 methylthiotransferase accessory factor